MLLLCLNPPLHLAPNARWLLITLSLPVLASILDLLGAFGLANRQEMNEGFLCKTKRIIREIICGGVHVCLVKCYSIFLFSLSYLLSS